MTLRDHTFLGTTQSLCPECLTLVPAKILRRGTRIYFRKRCPTHGVREDFVCSDASSYDRMEFSVPGRFPENFAVEPDKGCPYDCGLCTEHEQHTCVGLVEITSSCNLSCPMCYASSGPSGNHLSFEECKNSIDRLVKMEGRPEVLQLSGGEPTIHPEFSRILEYACAQPIDYVLINTNGIRFAHDRDLVALVGRLKHRVEIYFQWDGFREETSLALRGESLSEIKRKAVDALGVQGVHTTLVATLQAGVNEDEIGPIVKFGLERPWITGISFQPATYSGRHVLPETLERRITFPDVVQAIIKQTDGVFRTEDFLPLPCAHPNCHTLAYAYRFQGNVIPLTRFIPAEDNIDLLANGITFTRPKVQQLLEHYLANLSTCGSDCGCGPAFSNVVAIGDAPSVSSNGSNLLDEARREFFTKALAGNLYSEDVFRITITSFLDAYNFDVRRLMKCCIHHVLPSGHVIPFCAYNVLYREGHVPLPSLSPGGVVQISEPASL
ncbi:MAG: radical SAM protein [Planctomycetota bacterium]